MRWNRAGVTSPTYVVVRARAGEKDRACRASMPSASPAGRSRPFRVLGALASSAPTRPAYAGPLTFLALRSGWRQDFSSSLPGHARTLAAKARCPLRVAGLLVHALYLVSCSRISLGRGRGSAMIVSVASAAFAAFAALALGEG